MDLIYGNILLSFLFYSIGPRQASFFGSGAEKLPFWPKMGRFFGQKPLKKAILVPLYDSKHRFGEFSRNEIGRLLSWPGVVS